MIPNPIHKVLSSMQENRIRALLMGGQACVFYGAVEFSCGVDFAILADTANLVKLRLALADLKAEVIAVPPLELKYLRRGHAIHFRCLHPKALHIQVDVMFRMRGVNAFSTLWWRRTTIIPSHPTERPLAVIVHLQDGLASRWSDKQSLAVTGTLRGWSKEPIASTNWSEPISQQAVAQHLDRTGWIYVESAPDCFEETLSLSTDN